MNKVFLVALREFFANIRTKTFWIGLVSFPLLIIVFAVLPKWFEGKKDVRTYAVIDYSGWLLPRIEKTLDASQSLYVRERIEKKSTEIQAELNKKIQNGELFAYFVVGKDPVQGSEGCKYISNNLTDMELKMWFSALASEAVRQRRLKEKDIDPAVAQWIQAPLQFEGKTVGAEGTEKEVKQTDTLRKWAPAIFVYLLFVSVIILCQMLVMSTIEEKSNRTVEVLLSSMSPHQLMNGKIVGSAVTGLIIIGSWVISLVIGWKCLPLLDIHLGEIDIFTVIKDPLYIVSFILYFLSGFLLYSALLVGLGSVCNTVKELQHVWTPIMLAAMVPIMTMGFIVKDPNGQVARILSYIPLWTPFAMMNRAGGPPPVLDYILTSIIMIISLIAAFWGAGRIFRIGILMTGQPPKLREIIRWLAYPEGKTPVRKDK